MRALLLAGALLCRLAGPAVAQRRGDQTGDLILDAAGAPGGDFNVSAARRHRGFQLFATADGAGAGMHMVGNFDYALDNYSPCDNPISGFCAWNVRAARGGGTWTFQFFEVLFAAGVPPSEWAKAIEKVPSLRNAKGGGYSYLTNFGLFSGRYEWGPRDGSLGTLFSGIATAPDSTCVDQSGFGNGDFTNYAGGAQLLASSDCPITWPNGVWRGDREVSAEGWKRLFDAQGANFRWDYWRVADSLKRSSPFLGTRFSTYGETTDHYREILPTYGNVIPGGVGAPTVDGWPLGLVWRFEAFDFAVPWLDNVVFYRATVINRSEDVYGVGLDYDSLYLGFQEGQGHSTGAGGDRGSNYYLPDISTGLYHQSFMVPGGPCTEPARHPSGVSVCAAMPMPNMQNGGNAIIVLKSPIGDLRNKLFTRTVGGVPCQVGVDPFCDPSNPLAGDTITFNHGHICGYGSCWATVQNVNDKRAFGLLASNAKTVLDGRDPSSLTNGEAWLTFRTKGFPTERGKFNTYVPGVQGPPADQWRSTLLSHNQGNRVVQGDDGLPDTLFFDTCADQGCVVTSWDTMPGGQLNAYANLGGTINAGPFRLAAGDSTSWFVAFVGDADSARTWASIDAAIEMYLRLFPTPEPPPPPSIAATRLTAATNTGRNVPPEVRLFFTDAPEQWVDPYLTNLAAQLDSAPPGTPLGALAAANPTLSQQVRARAADNFERLEIYKSCDGGVTFTGDADCVGDQARDATGHPIDLGWVAYATFEPATGVPNVFTDDNVQAGKTYLYVLVTKSRGATFLVTDPETREPAQIEFAPSIRSPLVRAATYPNVASLYVPVSHPAGQQPAQVTYAKVGMATVPFSIDLTDAPQAGTYTVAFGNRITVERDSLLADDPCGVAGTVCGTRVIVTRVVNAAPGGTPTVVWADTTFRDGAEVLPVAGTPNASRDTVVGAVHRRRDVYDRLGFVLLAGSRPVFASTTLTGADATPVGVFALSDFPGFLVSANTVQQNAYDLAGEAVFRSATTIQQLGLPDTSVTVPWTDVDRFMVQWREQNSTRATYGLGRYVVHWNADAFGLPRGLSTLGPTSAAELAAALAARLPASTGLTDAQTAALLDTTLTNPITIRQQDLVPVHVPFWIQNTTFQRTVSIAMVRRTLTQPLTVANTYRLGSGADTLRVPIPEDEWVPGDQLVFIEDVTRDWTVGGNVVLDPLAQPVRVTNPIVTFTSAVLGCNTPYPPYCNPLGPGVPGASGYLATQPGDSLQFAYYLGFSPGDRWVFDVVPPASATADRPVTDSALALIRVVPNPFIIYSSYQASGTDSRILWTNLPPTGTLRIYTVSGQFVQQLTWTPAELSGTGDLAWNLRSQENMEVASGLYLWVLTAPSNPDDPSSVPRHARGKFVVIRGRPL